MSDMSHEITKGLNHETFVFSIFRVFVIIGSSLFAIGCGEKLNEVRGKVAYEDGTPLAQGLVVFESQAEKQAITARGEIQADGSFVLSTHAPGDGVPAGKYRVLVVPGDSIDATGQPRPPSFDKRFSDFGTSGLEFEVRDGPNEFPIKVTKPGR